MPAARQLLPIVALSLALAGPAAGCGSSGNGATTSTESAAATAATPAAPPGASARSCEGVVAGIGQLRVTGTGCDVGRGVAATWANKPACSRPAGASRYSCAVFGGYRCLSATTERGIAVSCAHPGRSIAFLAKRG